MKSITIDLEYLVFAYRDEETQNIYYLDTEYGEIRLVNRGLSDLKDLTDEIEISHDKFLYIPKQTKEELIEDLQAFSSSLADAKLKGMLPLAFEHPHVFATYKAILAPRQDELTRLDQFLKDKARARLLIWLKANSVEANA
jgi:hypothetical protein